MSDYKIFNFDEEVNKNYIFLNSVEDLYFLVDDIYNNLSKINGSEFSVIVDLFLRNGYSFNRYVQLNFKDGTYTTMIRNPNDISDISKRTIHHYLKENIEILYNGALTQRTIDYVLNN